MKEGKNKKKLQNKGNTDKNMRKSQERIICSFLNRHYVTCDVTTFIKKVKII